MRRMRDLRTALVFAVRLRPGAPQTPNATGSQASPISDGGAM
jgi:hypothetical protein